MKKTSRIFSALLLGAVVVFGASSCAGKGEQAAEAPAATPSEQTAAKGSIVYIDMTALMADYDMANDLRAVVETKVQNIQAEISRREKKFTSEYNDFQDKMQKGLLTRSVEGNCSSRRLTSTITLTRRMLKSTRSLWS